jgi:hypothetical protein
LNSLIFAIVSFDTLCSSFEYGRIFICSYFFKGGPNSPSSTIPGLDSPPGVIPLLEPILELFFEPNLPLVCGLEAVD